MSADKTEVVVRQTVIPNAFRCIACNLKLNGYSELNAASLGDQYTRTSTYLPDEYYGLIDPQDPDAISDLVSEHIEEYHQQYLEGLMEYDND